MHGNGQPIAVAPLSRASIEKFALDVRRLLAVPDNQAVDMLKIIEFVLPQVLPNFEYEIVEDRELGDAEATTSTTDRLIRISARCYAEARARAARPQFTLAHELGHLLLHCGKPFHLARGEVKAYASPEWQADTFAGAFLSPADEVKKCLSVDEIAARFAISKAAANVRAQQLQMPFAQKKKGY
jgi:hypothetical protein